MLIYVPAVNYLLPEGPHVLAETAPAEDVGPSYVPRVLVEETLVEPSRAKDRLGDEGEDLSQWSLAKTH